MPAVGFLLIALAFAAFASVANGSWPDVWNNIRDPDWWAGKSTAGSGSAIAQNPAPGTPNLLNLTGTGIAPPTSPVSVPGGTIAPNP